VAEMFRSAVLARGLRAASLLLLVFLGSTSAILGWADREPNPVFVMLLSSIFAIVTGAGIIGCDATDGTVQLVLGRPITRNQYLAGRGLGAAALALAGGLLIFGCNVAGIRLHGPFQQGLEAGWLALALSAHLLWQVALCFALSTIVPGRGDVVVYLLLLVTGPLLASQANTIGWPWLSSFFYWWREQIENGLTLLGGPSPLIWQDLARWASNLVAVLFLGFVAFYRREFSYGTN
jgi:ABC-2 family transporter